MSRSKRNPDQCYLYRSQGPLGDRTRFMVHEDTAAYESVKTSSGWATTKRVAFRARDSFWGYPKGQYIHGSMDARYLFPAHVLTMAPPTKRSNPESLTVRLIPLEKNRDGGNKQWESDDGRIFVIWLANTGLYSVAPRRSGEEQIWLPLQHSKLDVEKYIKSRYDKMDPRSVKVIWKSLPPRRVYGNPRRGRPTGRYLLIRRAGDYAVLDTLDRRWRSGATPSNWKDTGFRAGSAGAVMLEARRRQAGRQKGMDRQNPRRRNPTEAELAARDELLTEQVTKQLAHEKKIQEDREVQYKKHKAINDYFDPKNRALHEQHSQEYYKSKGIAVDAKGLPVPKINPSPRMVMLQQELARVKALLRRASEADAVVLRSAKRLLERRIRVMYRQPVRM